MLQCNVFDAMLASGLKSRGTLLRIHLEQPLLRITKTSPQLVVFPLLLACAVRHSITAMFRHGEGNQLVDISSPMSPTNRSDSLHNCIQYPGLPQPSLILLIAVRYDQLHAAPRPRRGSTARLAHSIGGRFNAFKIELAYDSV